MSETEWRLLTTLTDLPSAQMLAEALNAEGIGTRLASDASVLGQAAPTRVYVEATDAYRAQLFLTQRQVSDEELELLATDPAGGGPPE
jgi:hypothetical protein